MSVKITDITNRKHERYLKHIGVSGKKYVFSWDKEVGRYVFEANTQIEIDDLFEGSKVWGQQYFSLVMPPQPQPAKKQARKRPARKKAPAKSASDEKQTVGRSVFEPTV